MLEKLDTQSPQSQRISANHRCRYVFIIDPVFSAINVILCLPFNQANQNVTPASSRPMLTRSLLFLPMLSLLACEIGLKTGAIPEDTGFDEPSSEPSSDPWDTNDTDTTDTADTTDTTDTTDTQDTSTLGDLLPNLITSVSPGYGSTAGGTLTRHGRSFHQRCYGKFWWQSRCRYL